MTRRYVYYKCKRAMQQNDVSEKLQYTFMGWLKDPSLSLYMVEVQDSLRYLEKEVELTNHCCNFSERA